LSFSLGGGSFLGLCVVVVFFGVLFFCLVFWFWFAFYLLLGCGVGVGGCMLLVGGVYVCVS